MAEQDLIKVAKEAVEAFNKADWDRSMALLGPGTYNEVGTGRQLRGKAEILPALQGWRKAMPDCLFEAPEQQHKSRSLVSGFCV